uniref:B30.2/SPRY domain-containing protein n=1 Tax=Amphiprion ocellaris TaxID=80972 RepID=A0A3Q1C6P8_AMPOC
IPPYYNYFLHLYICVCVCTFAEDLEVRWFRDNDFDSPIILYQGKKVTVNQEASYAGRVSFGLKDTNSDGLKSGDVSLKLENAVIEDIGDYTCYVSSYQGYDSATINLLVTGESPPLLSAVWTEDNRVNVSCESEGWYPKPALRWLDQTQDLTPGTVLYGNDVTFFIISEPHNFVSIGNRHMKFQGLINTFEFWYFIWNDLNIRFPALYLESGSSTAGWVAFSLLLVGIILAGLAVMYIRRKVNIQLEDTNNRYITMKGTLLRDAPCDNFPDGQNVTCLTAVKGTSGFSCGRHYWEVSLNNPKLGPKQSWWVGVTSATKIPQKLDPPNTADGFWFLSSSPNRADRFQFSTEPKVFIGCPRPQTVGVFLDYDGGELYFYNVEDTTLIGSFKATFRGEVFPLFNPGKGDQAPLEILHREEVNQSGDERDCVVSVAQ